MFFVFVDTQMFRAAAFGFDTSPALVALRNAVADHRITVLMTTITEREIRRLLEKEVTNALQAVKKAIKDNYMLKAAPFVDVEAVRRARKEEVAAKALELWEKYRASIAPRMIDFDSIKPSEIMDAHFGNEPPFSASKPNEFRDAFVLRALLGWAEAEDQQVLVVSGDDDHAKTCDGTRLQHIKTLDEAVARSRDDEAIEQQARDALANQEDRIKELLDERFPEIPISIEDDPDAEAEDHAIDSIRVEPEDFVLVEFRDGHVVISGTIVVSFSFTATINDYANGSRDEGDWVYLPHYTYNIRTTSATRVAIRMPFGGAPAKPGDVEEVTIESPKRISLSLDGREVDAEVVRGWADED